MASGERTWPSRVSASKNVSCTASAASSGLPRYASARAYRLARYRSSSALKLATSPPSAECIRPASGPPGTADPIRPVTPIKMPRMAGKFAVRPQSGLRICGARNHPAQGLVHQAVAEREALAERGEFAVGRAGEAPGELVRERLGEADIQHELLHVPAGAERVRVVSGELPGEPGHQRFQYVAHAVRRHAPAVGGDRRFPRPHRRGPLQPRGGRGYGDKPLHPDVLIGPDGPARLLLFVDLDLIGEQPPSL